jgi:hypothetical protein
MEVAELVILMHPHPSMRHFSLCTERDVKEVVACVGTTGLGVAVELVCFSVVSNDGGQDVLVECAADKKVGHLHRVLLSKLPYMAHGLAVGCWVPT